MLVICKNCSASYAVPITKVGPNGREVKCAKCMEVFFVEPNQEAYKAAIDIEKLAEEIQNKNIEAFVDESQSDYYPDEYKTSESLISSKLFSIILLVILLGLSSVFFYPRLVQMPFAVKAYAYFGIYSTHNISLDDITIEETADDENSSLKISGSITNNNKHLVYLPNLRISVRDRAGNELLGYTTDYWKETLLPGSKYKFSNIVTNPSSYAETIVIDIGNPVELLLR